MHSLILSTQVFVGICICFFQSKKYFQIFTKINLFYLFIIIQTDCCCVQNYVFEKMHESRFCPKLKRDILVESKTKVSGPSAAASGFRFYRLLTHFEQQFFCRHCVLSKCNRTYNGRRVIFKKKQQQKLCRQLHMNQVELIISHDGALAN